MIHKLIYPFEHEERQFTEICVDDHVKVRHTMASMRVTKLAADLEKSGISLGKSLEDCNFQDIVKYAEFKAETDRIMFEAYCRDFPPDAIGELSDEDKDLIDAHIQKVIDKNNRRKASLVEPAPEKKRIRPAKSVS